MLPNQAGLNTNPQWAPDGKSIAFVSDRDGTSNLFLYDFTTRTHYQLTDLVGAVSAITEYSPSITWARGADRLAFTYFENGEYTIWQVSNPRLLKKDPYSSTPAVIAADGVSDARGSAQNNAPDGALNGDLSTALKGALSGALSGALNGGSNGVVTSALTSDATSVVAEMRY